MAMGVPMVATDAGGNAEAIQDGVSGFIVPRSKPEMLAEKVIKILTDGKLASHMGSQARLRAHLFSLETMVEKTKDLYHTLLAEKRIISW